MAILVNPGTTTPVATLDIGAGVQSPQVNLISATGGTLYGSAGSPAAGTTVLAVQGVSGGTPQPISISSGTAGSTQVGTWTVQPGNTPNTSPWLVTVASGTTAAIGAVTQSGTWTVQPGNTQNTIPWLIQPVSTASINQAGTWTVQPGNTQNTTPWLVGQAVGSAYATNITQVGSATINLGAGTGGTGTIRTIIDSSQLSPLGQTTSASSVPVVLPSDFVGTTNIQFSASSNSTSSAIGAITGTSITTLLSAPGAGQRNYLTQLLVTNAHATTSTVVVVGDGSAATTLTQGYAVAAGGGFAVTFPQPLRQPTTNTSLTCYCVTTGSSIYVSVSGFKSA